MLPSVDPELFEGARREVSGGTRLSRREANPVLQSDLVLKRPRLPQRNDLEVPAIGDSPNQVLMHLHQIAAMRTHPQPVGVGQRRHFEPRGYSANPTHIHLHNIYRLARNEIPERMRGI